MAAIYTVLSNINGGYCVPCICSDEIVVVTLVLPPVNLHGFCV
jgi:hypothetical protein